jgi:hypothetical protein
MTIKYTGDNQELLNQALPYVYVGIRRTDGKIYIGARCANKVPAVDDLGKFYFTSSKNVVFDEFDWEILFIGNTRDEVFDFEGELIDFYLKSGVLINRRGTKGFYIIGPLSEETKRKMRKPKSEEHKENVSKGNKGKPKSTEHKANMSKARKGNPLTEESKANISKALKGKPKSEEHKANFSNARKGKPLSDKNKEGISNALKGKPHPQKTITCPHCGKSGGNVLKRYHFDNCKHLKQIETCIT